MKKWKSFIPVFDIFISLPKVRFQLGIVTDNPSLYNEWIEFTYLGYQWEIWKWNGFIRINKLHTEFITRKVPQGHVDDVEVSKCGCFTSKKHKFRKFCDEHTPLFI